jgi:hypothetical protein
VLLANRTAIETLRAAAAAETPSMGDMRDSFTEIILDLEERVASLENSAPGAALANLRWRNMAQSERQDTLAAAKAQRGNGRQD